ncbi:MAG: hypothetical protein AAB460_00755 [Patescibacteria group bacterium]
MNLAKERAMAATGEPIVDTELDKTLQAINGAYRQLPKSPTTKQEVLYRGELTPDQRTLRRWREAGILKG